jgi:hypothetical protein
MNQLDALYIALSVLESHAASGDDECAEAAAKITQIITRYHRAKAFRGIYRKAAKKVWK